jgi:hypothetical protein
MNLMKSLRSAAVAVMLFAAGVANAGVYQFNLTGDYTASWRLNATVAPDDGTTGQDFVVWDVAGTFPGASLGIVDLTFYNAALGGGLQIEDFWGSMTLVSTEGAQLYTGPESAPVFRLGTFGLTEFLGSGTYTLMVTEVNAGPVNVPEPATGALLFGGLGLMYALRKRRYGK